MESRAPGGSGAGFCTFANKSLAAIESSATTIFIADGDGAISDVKWADINDANGVKQADLKPDPTAPQQRWLNGVIERHLETANMLYVGGHVKAHKLDILLTSNNTTPARTQYTTIRSDLQ